MYNNLLALHDAKSANEAPASYCCLQERHAQVLWFEQKYFRNLCTITGEPIRIFSPGIWNLEAGPDFLKAHLLIGKRECRGDIEIHLSANSWIQHKHHLDHRYNEVVLHLVFWPSKKPVPTVTHDGVTIAQAYIEPHLTISPQRLIQLIDLDLYPYKQFVGSGRCARELFRTLPEAKIRSFFQDAADYRLQKKSERLQQDLIGGIATALGYKQNAQAFHRLYEWLRTRTPLSETARKLPRIDKRLAIVNPQGLDTVSDKEVISLPALGQTQLTTEELLAAGMQAFGFFVPYYQEKWGQSEMYRRLSDLDQKSTIKAPAEKLVLSQIRPLNHPLRRLVYLSKLLTDSEAPLLQMKLLEQWDLSWTLLKKRSFLEWLHNLLPNYQDPYWNTHYTFEASPQKKCLPLMGSDLKTEIAVNVLLPYLAGGITAKSDHVQELKALQELYAEIAAPKTNKGRYLSHRFFGDSAKTHLLKKAQLLQGAYQLHNDFCVQYEASCDGCPFVDRYKSHR